MDQKLTAAINSIKVLRSNVSILFNALADRTTENDGDENRNENFMVDFRELVDRVNQNIREVHLTVIGIPSTPAPSNLASTSLLASEVDLERQELYNQLVNTYKWHDKVHEFSTVASSLFSSNNLKRSYQSNASKNRRPILPSHKAPAQIIDRIINSMVFSDMTWKIERPLANDTFLHINLFRVLRAVIVLRGLIIEWITVKSFDESLDNVNDNWTESRYQVFQKVQDHTHSAMLHFFSPTVAELAFKGFIRWFRSYSSLFIAPCKKCGKHLRNALPPTWRDFRTLEPFHEDCRY